MEVVAGDAQRLHLGVADLDALVVDSSIESALDLQSGFCGRRADQFADREAIGQGPAASVLRDVAELAMFDLVPLRRSRRIVKNVQGKPGLVGEFLKKRAAFDGRDSLCRRRAAWRYAAIIRTIAAAPYRLPPFATRPPASSSAAISRSDRFRPLTGYRASLFARATVAASRST